MNWIKCDGLKDENCPCVALARWRDRDGLMWEVIVVTVVGDSGDIYDTWSEKLFGLKARMFEYYFPIPKLPGI